MDEQRSAFAAASSRSLSSDVASKGEQQPNVKAAQEIVRYYLVPAPQGILFLTYIYVYKVPFQKMIMFT